MEGELLAGIGWGIGVPTTARQIFPFLRPERQAIEVDSELKMEREFDAGYHLRPI
jgi:hypothetical protein